jgi:hypothetical protein
VAHSWTAVGMEDSCRVEGEGSKAEVEVLEAEDRVVEGLAVGDQEVEGLAGGARVKAETQHFLASEVFSYRLAHPKLEDG